MVSIAEFIFTAVYCVCGLAILQKVASLSRTTAQRWGALLAVAALLIVVYAYFFMPLMREDIAEFFDYDQQL